MVPSAAVFVFPTGMISAGVAAFMMVAAYNVRIKEQFSLQKGFHAGICTACHTRIQFYTRLGQCCTGTTANPAADQRIWAKPFKKLARAP